MAITLAALIVKCRTEVDDLIDPAGSSPPSHPVMKEPLNGLINGVNMRFLATHFPVVGPTANVVVEDSAGTVYTLNVAAGQTDFNRGILILTAAPPGSVSGVFGTYYAAFSTDGQWTEWLDTVLRRVGLAGTSEIASLADGLVPAVVEWGKEKFYRQTATKAADYFTSSAGGRSASKGEVFAHWKELADKADEAGQKARDDFYQTQGRQYRPALGIGAAESIGPYTPIR